MSLTADQIVTLACQKAKCPGFVTQGQQYLNRFQENLAQNYDFPAAAYTFTNFVVTPNGGTGTGTSTSPGTNWYLLTLPASSTLVQNGARYLRTHSVFYQVSGQIFYLMQLDTPDYDKLFQGAGLQNYPYAYEIDMTGAPNLATPQMALYNPPSMSLSLTIRCQYQPNDITTAQFAAGTHIPWFPNQDILIEGVSEMLFRTTDPDEADRCRMRLYGDPAKNDGGMISRYLRMDNDKENFAATVKRDRRTFRNPQVLPATKTTVW